MTITTPSVDATAVRVQRRTPQYWRVTFDNPPVNMFDPELLAGLRTLIGELENDRHVQVVVFDSADPDFFISHLDLRRAGQGDRSPGPTGMSPWPDFAVRLSRLPVVTIAAVRGRARGVGNEVALAADLRFASRERAVFGQFEVGSAAIPGGGGLERLTGLLGRARALEAITSGADFDADTAERYGWINRALPDNALDDFVEDLATRIASFDREAIRTAKQLINSIAPPPGPDELAISERAFFGLLSRPAARAAISWMLDHGLQSRSDLEYNLGARLPEVAAAGRAADEPTP